MKESYNPEEAEEILKRAAARTSTNGGVSRERLLAMAAELGLSPGEVDAAAAEIEMVQEERELRAAFIAERRSTFWAHLIPFVCVNLMLLVINILSGFGHPWFLYPLMGWGIGLASHAYEALPTRGPQFEKEFAQWREKRSDKERRRERRQRRSAKNSGTVEETMDSASETEEGTSPVVAARNASAGGQTPPAYGSGLSPEEGQNVVRVGGRS